MWFCAGKAIYFAEAKLVWRYAKEGDVKFYCCLFVFVVLGENAKYSTFMTRVLCNDVLANFGTGAHVFCYKSFLFFSWRIPKTGGFEKICFGRHCKSATSWLNPKRVLIDKADLHLSSSNLTWKANVELEWLNNFWKEQSRSDRQIKIAECPVSGCILHSGSFIGK